nr:chromosome partitioning protein ParB [bacterium]BDD47320.1 chromosome partitioning protein ParB [bacterium]
MIAPFVNTETERLNKVIEESTMTKEQIIQEYIDKHDISKYREGVDYYFKKNEIVNRNIYKYDNNGNKVIDHDATNNKMASGWHKLLVDQKTAYLVGEPITINSKNDDDSVVESINDVLGDSFNDVMPELVKNAANKGREWLHPYIDENGEFDYMIVPAEEGIPIYDNTKRKDLIGFIRMYELDDETVKIELWDDQRVTYYEYHNGRLVLDMSYEENPASHFQFGNKGYGWGYPPFVEFANNEERVSDLTFIKDYVDVYDLLTADASNTLEDIQQFLYVIKGYSDTDIGQAVTNLKRFKGVAVDGDGGVDIKQGEMPMQSLDSFLNRIEDNIYSFGMAVDTTADKFGSNPSGVSLKFLYSFLDMKASITERRFTRAVKALIWFACEYISISENKVIDYKDITTTFNKSMITNEVEKVQMARDSMGIISRETIMEHHPFVTDVQIERERLEKEQSGSMVDLDSIGDGDGRTE